MPGNLISSYSLWPPIFVDMQLPNSGQADENQAGDDMPNATSLSELGGEAPLCCIAKNMLDGSCSVLVSVINATYFDMDGRPLRNFPASQNT